MKTRCFILASFLTMSFTLALYGQAPQLINYQGNLNQNGTSANGTFNITFSIFDSEADGNQLWTETQSVGVTNGSFNVLLGSVTAFPAGLFTTLGDRYLGIKVENDAEMTPRFRLTSVAYSLNAKAVSGGAPKSNIFPADGNVGIGTRSPAAKLQVFGGPLWTDANFFKSLSLSPGSAIEFQSFDSTRFGIGASTDPITALYVWSTKAVDTEAPANYRIILDEQGFVGIGTISPSERLHVRENLSATIARFEGNGQGSATFFDGTEKRGAIGFGSSGHMFTNALANSLGIRSESALHLGVDTSIAMTIREVGYPPGTGYIGVGITEPTAILHVGGEASPRIYITSNSPGPNPSQTWGLLSFTDGNFYITDVTNSIDRLLITPDGNVGIGMSSPESPSERLHVIGNILASGSITEGSSRELKDNISDLTSDEALEAFSELKPVKYNYRAEKSKDLHVGFIAEDVPEMVATPDRKSLSSMDIVAVLTKVVQEQQKTISELKARVEALEVNK